MEKPSVVTAVFFKAAGAIADALDKYAAAFPAFAALKRFLLEKNRTALQSLSPSEDAGAAVREHFTRKLAYSLMIISIGFVFFILLSLKGNENEILADGALARHEAGNGSYDVTLKLNANGKEYKNVDIHIPERKYTQEELTAMLPGFHEALEKSFLGDNSDASRISSPVDPVSRIDGYPFDIEWEYSDSFCIDADGNIRITPDEEGTLIEVCAIAAYEDFRERYIFPVILIARDKDEKTRFLEKLHELIDESDKLTATTDSLPLPTEMDGIVLCWSENKKNNALLLFILSVAAGLILFFAADNDISKQLKARDEEMLLDYPEIISKIVLYAGAGMTVRMAWKKTAEECSEAQAAHYAYREMRLTVREMERGEGELAAYRHFAKRCRLQQYVKFISLLEQNVKLGASGFLSSLRKEAAEALEDRKAIAKRQGEEAGTKLLLPMMMMLAIVMAVIIVPAFTGI
ncbi:MAG: hypothetical protein K5686_08045 [Lachnospiraceae bacterium]|nr:hypothetical protein [Lachnospiraceae bacterium]